MTAIKAAILAVLVLCWAIPMLKDRKPKWRRFMEQHHSYFQSGRVVKP